MKSLPWKLSLMVAVSLVALLGSTRWVRAAEEIPAGSDERFQRLERRINELAERQEQMMRRLGAPPESPGQAPRRFAGSPGPQPMPGPEALRPATPIPGEPAPIAAPQVKRIGDLIGLVFMVWILCNILLAIWIFTDIRRRGEGSGVFVVLAVLAGIPAAIIYSLVRIGDRVALTAK